MEERTNTASLRKDRDIYQTNALENYYFYKQQQKKLLKITEKVLYMV